MIMEKITYTPIDCGFYDVLEVASMRREYLDIQYLDENDVLVAEKVFIETLWAKNGEEFMKLHNGKVVRLDRIKKLDSYYDDHESWAANCVCK